MKAAYYEGIGRLSVEEVDLPSISDDDMLLKVKYAAICGTDIRIFKNGHFKIKDGEKRVLSHEVVGEVAKVGKNVSCFSPGMRVAVVPNIGCGYCYECIQGFNELCADYEAFGISLDGGFQEYMVIPGIAIQAGNILNIPQNLSYKEAVLAEPLSCCYNSYRSHNTSPGDTVLVIGAGPVGALHVLLNKFVGASKIISADLSERRLEKIRELGADLIIDTSKTDLLDRLMELTDGRGADVVIVACSVPALQTLSVKLAAPHGRVSFFGGLPEGRSNVEIDTNIMHYKELKLVGTTGSNILDFKKALDILASGRLEVEKIITNVFSIDQIEQAFAFAMSGEGLKTAISF